MANAGVKLRRYFGAEEMVLLVNVTKPPTLRRDRKRPTAADAPALGADLKRSLLSAQLERRTGKGVITF